MKAVDFIRKFGWEEVIKAVKNVKPYEEYIIGIYTHEPREINDKVFIDRTPCSVSVDDLKRYIDAYELVQKRGGLSEAKEIEQQYRNSGVGSAMLVAMELKQAIQLVEEVCSVNR